MQCMGDYNYNKNKVVPTVIFPKCTSLTVSCAVISYLFDLSTNMHIKISTLLFINFDFGILSDSTRDRNILV